MNLREETYSRVAAFFIKVIIAEKRQQRRALSRNVSYLKFTRKKKWTGVFKHPFLPPLILVNGLKIL